MAGGQVEASHALAAGGGDTGMELGLMAASVLLVLVAILVAYTVYNKKPHLATSWRDKLSGVHHLLLNKYFVDEIYSALIVRPVIYISLFCWKIVDVILIDGTINGVATIYGDISQTARASQTGRVRTYATLFLAGAVAIVAWFIWI